MSEAEETGWLIELPVNDKRGRPEWLRGFCLEEGDPFLLSPTTNADEAVRFARKCDAEMFLYNLQRLHPGVWDECITTDHSWSMGTW